jgi:hypothetical protein
MRSPFPRALGYFFGAPDTAITLPPMDGTLRPNQALESASPVLEIERPDNLVRERGRILFSSGNTVFTLEENATEAKEVIKFKSEVSCLAGDENGNVVAGLNDGTLYVVFGPRQGEWLPDPGARPSCPTALLIDGQSLIVCHGSKQNKTSAWKQDLMERNASGSVWRIDLVTGSAACLAEKLAFPYGVTRTPAGGFAVSESWRHRVIAVSEMGNRALSVLLDQLPGYPARLSVASNGGYWLCIFAPRSRLVEFVLRERNFCRDMFREVEPEFWPAPSLKSGGSFLEPMQGGGIKQLGRVKPWAPSRSYGLLVKLDANFDPVASFHSRSDGKRHGVTACIDLNDRILVASKGGDAIIALKNSKPGDECA